MHDRTNTGVRLLKLAGLPLALMIVLLMTLSMGCSTTYESYAYKPRPASVTMESPEIERGSITVLASVLGIRTGREQGSFVDIRMRVDNDTDQNIRVLKDGLKLYSADLSAFHRIYTEPGQIPAVSPAGSLILNVGFGFPQSLKPSEVDLTNLSLGWKVKIGDRTLGGNASFEREEPEVDRSYNPYWYQPYPVIIYSGWYYQ